MDLEDGSWTEGDRYFKKEKGEEPTFSVRSNSAGDNFGVEVIPSSSHPSSTKLSSSESSALAGLQICWISSAPSTIDSWFCSHLFRTASRLVNDKPPGLRAISMRSWTVPVRTRYSSVTVPSVETKNIWARDSTALMTVWATDEYSFSIAALWSRRMRRIEWTSAATLLERSFKGVRAAVCWGDGGFKASATFVDDACMRESKDRKSFRRVGKSDVSWAGSSLSMAIKAALQFSTRRVSDMIDTCIAILRAHFFCSSAFNRWTPL